MSPRMVISNGVRYPRDFAEKHGIKADREIETQSAADRTHTHAGIGTVVQDDLAGSVITSAAADVTTTTGTNVGLANPALAEAEAAAAAGKGEVGTEGATDNTTAGGTTGETTTTENGATDGTSGDGAAAGDADGTAGAGSTSNRRSAKGK